MNLFPFVPFSSLGDGTSRDLLLNFTLKRQKERAREKGDEEETEIL